MMAMNREEHIIDEQFVIDVMNEAAEKLQASGVSVNLEVKTDFIKNMSVGLGGERKVHCTLFEATISGALYE